jgi:hypothetical protein
MDDLKKKGTAGVNLTSPHLPFRKRRGLPEVTAFLSASGRMQLQSILATQERAAGALFERPRSAGYFEIRRMSGYGMTAWGGYSEQAVLGSNRFALNLDLQHLGCTR